MKINLDIMVLLVLDYKLLCNYVMNKLYLKFKLQILHNNNLVILELNLI